VFTDPLTEATGLSRLDLSTAYLFGTGASGLLLPRGGLAIDRYGPRLTATTATVGLALTLLALSMVGAMSRPMGLVVMSVGFGLIRFCGQGMLTLSSRTMVSQWFERRRGTVTSAANTVMSFFFSLMPALLLALIKIDGFRTAWRLLALGLVFVAVTVIFTLFRDSPESVGLAIDGGEPTTPSSGPVVIGTDQDATRAQAVRDLRFWIITMPVVAMSAVSTALTFHILDLGGELNLSDDRMVAIFVPISLVSIPVTLLGGWLTDRVSPIWIAASMATFQIAMFLTVSRLNQPVFYAVAVVAWGAAQGCYAPLTSAAVPQLFGRRYLGAINGLQMSAMVIGSAIGPAMFSFMKLAFGSYRQALTTSLAIPALTLVLASVHVGRLRR